MSERPEPKFRVGQVVVIILPSKPSWNGREAFVVEANFARTASLSLGLVKGWAYRLDCGAPNDLGDWWVEPLLRPLPDGNQPATFDAAIWQPKREGVGA